MPNYIAFAIPFFFVCIGIELLWARAAHRRVYRLNDALGDIGAGVFQRVCVVFMEAALLIPYTALYREHRFFTLSDKSVVTWVAAFVLVDLLYYWWHRLSHEVNLLWAAHVVHHSSEDFNFAVALRQGVLTPVTSLPFWLPLALLGFSPVVVATSIAFNTLYQFWIHTELIGKMGPLEWVLNTPSHHRVHHGINPRYLDKNYAGILIIWDRMFGTFAEEREPVVFGLVKPLQSLQPFRVQFHYWSEIFAMARAATAPLDKLRAFVRGPTWRPANLPQLGEAPEVNPATFVKYDPGLSGRVAAYLLAQFTLLTAAATALLFFSADLSWSEGIAIAVPILAGLAVIGAAMEHRRWALTAEWLRLFAVAALVATELHGRPAALAAALVGLGGLALWARLALRAPDPALAAPSVAS